MSLIDLINLNPSHFNTIDDEKYDENQLRMYKMVDIINQTTEVIIENMNSIMQDSFFLVKGSISITNNESSLISKEESVLVDRLRPILESPAIVLKNKNKYFLQALEKCTI